MQSFWRGQLLMGPPPPPDVVADAGVVVLQGGMRKVHTHSLPSPLPVHDVISAVRGWQYLVSRTVVIISDTIVDDSVWLQMSQTVFTV